MYDFKFYIREFKSYLVPRNEEKFFEFCHDYIKPFQMFSSLSGAFLKYGVCKSDFANCEGSKQNLKKILYFHQKRTSFCAYSTSSSERWRKVWKSWDLKVSFSSSAVYVRDSYWMYAFFGCFRWVWKKNSPIRPNRSISNGKLCRFLSAIGLKQSFWKFLGVFTYSVYSNIKKNRSLSINLWIL